MNFNNKNDYNYKTIKVVFKQHKSQKLEHINKILNTYIIDDISYIILQFIICPKCELQFNKIIKCLTCGKILCDNCAKTYNHKKYKHTKRFINNGYMFCSLCLKI